MTYHSASIAGYEGSPTPVATAGSGDTWYLLQGASQQAFLTEDHTWSALASVVRTQATPSWEGLARLDVSLGMSGYAALTEVVQSSQTLRLAGWGLAGHVALDAVVDFGDWWLRPGLTADGGWDQGPYSDWRHQSSPANGRVDLSPHDTTLTTQGRLGLGFHTDQDAFEVIGHVGIVDPDWPYRDRTLGLLRTVDGFTLGWRRGDVWVWFDWSQREFLNGGATVGIGLR